MHSVILKNKEFENGDYGLARYELELTLDDKKIPISIVQRRYGKTTHDWSIYVNGLAAPNYKAPEFGMLALCEEMLDPRLVPAAKRLLQILDRHVADSGYVVEPTAPNLAEHDIDHMKHYHRKIRLDSTDGYALQWVTAPDARTNNERIQFMDGLVQKIEASVPELNLLIKEHAKAIRPSQDVIDTISQGRLNRGLYDFENQFGYRPDTLGRD